MINKPHAIYYRGELIGIILNPDPHSNITGICDSLSPDEGFCEAREIPRNMGTMEKWADMANAILGLGIEETISFADHRDETLVQLSEMDFEAIECDGGFDIVECVTSVAGDRLEITASYAHRDAPENKTERHIIFEVQDARLIRLDRHEKEDVADATDLDECKEAVEDWAYIDGFY